MKDLSRAIVEATPGHVPPEGSPLSRGLDVLKRMPTRPASTPTTPDDVVGLAVDKAVDEIWEIVGPVSDELVKRVEVVIEGLYTAAWQEGKDQAERSDR